MSTVHDATEVKDVKSYLKNYVKDDVVIFNHIGEDRNEFIKRVEGEERIMISTIMHESKLDAFVDICDIPNLIKALEIAYSIWS